MKKQAAAAMLFLVLIVSIMPASAEGPINRRTADVGFISETGLKTGENLETALADKGYAAEEAMIAIYGEESEVTRYKWTNEGGTDLQTCFTDGCLTAVGILKEYSSAAEANEGIRTIYDALTELYGESDMPLAVPEQWPDFAFKDILLASWTGEGQEGASVFLVYQVTRNGCIRVEARVGNA